MDPTVVDVVVATRRGPRYLADTLASLVGQTYPHWTLTVVDDGGPDPAGVAEAVARVPGAQLLRHAPQGVSAARNAGLARGTGALVAFLDDDDVWVPGKLAAQVAALAAAPGSVAAFTGGWYMDADAVPFGPGWPAVPAAAAEHLRGAVPPPRIVTLLARREAVVAVGGFDPVLALGEDVDLVLRLLRRGPMVAVPGAMVGYRRHDGNASVADDLRARRAMRQVFRSLVAAAERDGDATAARLLGEHLARSRVEWGRSAVRSVGAAVRRRDVGAVRRELAWAARVVPGQTVRSASALLVGRVRRRSP